MPSEHDMIAACEAMEASAGKRLALLFTSFQRLTGKALAADPAAMWEAPHAIVAHGTEDPPRFFYGNAVALELFAMTPRQFIGLPSYRSAEPALREERAAMLAALEANDVVEGYNGVRIAADGSRFRIEDAVIWNIRDNAGKRHGQAATFARWRRLPA